MFCGSPQDPNINFCGGAITGVSAALNGSVDAQSSIKDCSTCTVAKYKGLKCKHHPLIIIFIDLIWPVIIELKFLPY